MKKLAILAVSALVLGGVLASASAAFAVPVAPTFTLQTATDIQNAEAVSGSWNDATVPLGFCVAANFANGNAYVVNPLSSLSPVSVAAGFSSPFNENLTAAPTTYGFTIYSVDLAGDCNSPKTLISEALWTVNPRLSVGTPADFTAGTPAERTVATSLHDFSTGPVFNLTEGAHWAVVPGAACEEAIVPESVEPAKYVALPVGFSVNPAVSAASTVPLLTFAGTATPDEVGSYQLCLNLVSDAAPLVVQLNPTTAFATTTLTVIPAPVVMPALANTGLDTSSLGAGGAGLLALGFLLISLLRRRKLTL